MRRVWVDNWKVSAAGRAYSKNYHAQWYKANRKRINAVRRKWHNDHRAISNRRKAVMKDAGTKFVARLKNKPCMDCWGWFEPCQMDFDHRPGEIKIDGIANLYGRCKEGILDEIAKCDLVCANCHRLRTYNRRY